MIHKKTYLPSMIRNGKHLVSSYITNPHPLIN